jgi:hypothetical protein
MAPLQYDNLLRDLEDSNIFFDALVDMIPARLYVAGNSGKCFYLFNPNQVKFSPVCPATDSNSHFFFSPSQATTNTTQSTSRDSTRNRKSLDVLVTRLPRGSSLILKRPKQRDRRKNDSPKKKKRTTMMTTKIRTSNHHRTSLPERNRRKLLLHQINQ